MKTTIYLDDDGNRGYVTRGPGENWTTLAALFAPTLRRQVVQDMTIDPLAQDRLKYVMESQPVQISSLVDWSNLAQAARAAGFDAMVTPDNQLRLTRKGLTSCYQPSDVDYQAAARDIKKAMM